MAPRGASTWTRPPGPERAAGDPTAKVVFHLGDCPKTGTDASAPPTPNQSPGDARPRESPPPRRGRRPAFLDRSFQIAYGRGHGESTGVRHRRGGGPRDGPVLGA